MRDLYSKTNAPYLIAGAIATLVLLASGTLAVAPYVKFLSSVAAFNVALPVALSLSILSILVLALSCKIISNNKKIEVEKNKFAEKEQKLESVKQQFENKVQELENKGNQIRELKDKIGALNNKNKDLHDENTELSAKVKGQLKHREEILSREHQELRDENSRIGELESELQKLTDGIAQEKKAKENVGREVKGLNNQLSGLTQEKQDADRVIEGLNKKVSQLECEKKNSLHYTEELRDENTRLSERLNERVDSLMEELSQPQKEIDSLKRQLHELKYEGTLALLLEERITELETCLEEKRKKVGELVVQLRKEKGETSSLQSELKSAKEKEEEILPTKKLSELTRKMHQLTVDLEQKEKLCKELEEEKTKDLNKIGELNKLLDQERKGNEKLRDNNSKLKNSEKDLDNECSKLRGRNFDLERKVKRLQAVIRQEDKQSHSISSDISSEHLSELEGTGENKLANGLTFPKPLFPHTSTPRGYPRKSLSPKKKDEDENKENSEQLNHESLDTNINSPHLSPFKDTTNDFYHTLTM